MSRAASIGASGGGTPDGELLTGYMQRSQAPLTCLLFLLPLLIAYEWGCRLMATSPEHLRAFHDVQVFFRFFGAVGRHLPSLAVATILLMTHIARKDPWKPDFATAGCMALESVALCLPLFLLDALSNRYIGLSSHRFAHAAWQPKLVMAIGAGIYEELVFRLALFTLLSILLIDVLRLPKAKSMLVIVVASAIAFSAYHYLGSEPFLLRTFAFRTGAGIYFGAIFLWRGFGITSGAHAAYDLIAVSLAASSAG
jgi:membrane protease YdiL (CAAX protease family)